MIRVNNRSMWPTLAWTWGWCPFTETFLLTARGEMKGWWQHLELIQIWTRIDRLIVRKREVLRKHLKVIQIRTRESAGRLVAFALEGRCTTGQAVNRDLNSRPRPRPRPVVPRLKLFKERRAGPPWSRRRGGTGTLQSRHRRRPGGGAGRRPAAAST